VIALNEKYNLIIHTNADVRERLRIKFQRGTKEDESMIVTVIGERRYRDQRTDGFGYHQVRLS
jgi:hypothetical protein